MHGMAPASLMAYTASFELIKPGCLLNRLGFKQLSAIKGDYFAARSLTIPWNEIMYVHRNCVCSVSRKR